MFNRKSIFKGSIFHCYVSLLKGMDTHYYFDPPAFFPTIILTPRTIAGEPLVVENSIKTIIAQPGFYGMGYTQSGPLPLPLISRLITPLIGVITPVTHLQGHLLGPITLFIASKGPSCTGLPFFSWPMMWNVTWSAGCERMKCNISSNLCSKRNLEYVELWCTWK